MHKCITDIQTVVSLFRNDTIDNLDDAAVAACAAADEMSWVQRIAAATMCSRQSLIPRTDNNIIDATKMAVSPVRITAAVWMWCLPVWML